MFIQVVHDYKVVQAYKDIDGKNVFVKLFYILEIFAIKIFQLIIGHALQKVCGTQNASNQRRLMYSKIFEIAWLTSSIQIWT